MASGQVKLTMAFNGEDKLAAVIEKSNRAMGRFGKTTKRTSKTATTGFARIQGTIKGVGTRLTELNSGIQLARQAFGALQAAGEAAISGEIANNAEKVFNQISGGADNAAKVMEKLREVSRGLLDDTTIQQFAGSLRIAGVEFSETARILDLSSRVALATGQDLETVSRKIKDAALAGRQGEFDRLGVVVRVNEELKKRAEAEGKVVDEMSKAEQVSTRMDILTETLGQTMAAAGIHTEDLSTNLRSMKTDLENLQSTAEQSFANFLTTKEMDQIRANLSKVAENITDQAGEFSLSILQNDKLMRGYFADASGLTLKELDQALKNLDGFTVGFQGAQVAITDAVIDQIIKTRRARRKAQQEEAKRVLEEKNEKEQAIKDERDFLVSQLTDLEVEKVRIGKDGKKQRLQLIDEEIKGIQIRIMELDGKGAGLIEKAQRMLSATIEANLAAAKKEDKERSKQAAAEFKRRQQEREREAKEQAQRQRDQRRKDLKAAADSNELKRKLQIEFFQDEKDTEIRHSLELQDLEIRKNTALNLLVDVSEAERQLARDQFAAEEVRLARSQADELLDIQKRADDQRLAEQEKAARKAAEILRLQREEFQKEMSEIARATNLLEAPINALVENQRTGVVQVRAMGGALMATSAAMNVYSNETDTSASAGERFKQGLPAMTHAGGVAAAAFVKNTKNKAIVQGSFEAASSIAAFATGNIPAGVGHAAAASMFFALAGKGGSGKTGGGQAAKTGALSAGGGGPSGLTAMGGGGAITVNVQGFALGSAREMGAKMAQTIDQARETGLDSSEV